MFTVITSNIQTAITPPRIVRSRSNFVQSLTVAKPVYYICSRSKVKGQGHRSRHKTLGKFLTHMCLCSPSSISWYLPKGVDALPLGNKGRLVRCGWQVKLCDPFITHGPYLSALEIRDCIIKCYINSPSLPNLKSVNLIYAFIAFCCW